MLSVSNSVSFVVCCQSRRWEFCFIKKLDFLQFFLICHLPFYINLWSLYVANLFLQFSPLSLWQGVILHLMKPFSEIVFGILQEISFQRLAFPLYLQNNALLLFFPIVFFFLPDPYFHVIVVLVVYAFFFLLISNKPKWTPLAPLSGSVDDRLLLFSNFYNRVVNICISWSNSKILGGFLSHCVSFLRKYLLPLFAWPSHTPCIWTPRIF